MAKYRISGVWKNVNGVITAYAFHTINDNSVDKAVKRSKTEAIMLLERLGNTATTWTWNYKAAKWMIGETVTVVGTGCNKYLRSDPDGKSTDNLAHLIGFDWILSS